MNSDNFTATISVDQNETITFNAIMNFRAWWSEEIDGDTDKINGIFLYHYKDIHICKIKLIEKIEGVKLVYEVMDNDFNFINDKTEWVGSKLIFELSHEGNTTIVKFTHEGLVPEMECYNVCNKAWTGYITKSLHKLITTGKGNPNPAEGEGFNAQLAKKWRLK